MAQHIKWSENKIKQLEAEGRGKGSGASYLPWVLVSDFSSRGNSRRVFSDLAKREHHFLSNVEYDFFLLMENSEDVVDFREQYPLPREDTLAIAAHLGIKHPVYPGTKVPAVLTCDAMVTRLRRGTPAFESYNCKRTEEAEDRRSLEKLEIQRCFLDGCAIPHHLIFHSMLPTNKVKSLEWIRSAGLLRGEIEPRPDYYKEHMERLSHDLATHQRAGSSAEYCANYDSRSGAIPGTGLRVIRMLLQQHQVVTDLSQPDLAAAPVSMFHVRVPGALKLATGS